MELLRSLLCGKPILITGSAGYLAFTLYLSLQKLGMAVFGIDVVPGPTVDKIVDVSDLEAMKRCGETCGAVLHSAALHAPHAFTWHKREFTATNVDGTGHVLALGLPTVYTSTTSLTITARVKAREKAGELVWLDEYAQRTDLTTADVYDPVLDAPRNKYGRTKLEGEQRCLAAARDGADVVVLRAPRFFPEEVIEENSLSLPNIKANELLGRRCALVDLVDAHLRALARVRVVRGAVLTIAAPWRGSGTGAGASSGISAQEAASQLRDRHHQAERLYAQHGWRLPEAITRVYDCEAAVKGLGWQPRITFEALLHVMEVHEHSAQEDPAALDSVGESDRPHKHPKVSKLRRMRRMSLGEFLRGAF